MTDSRRLCVLLLGSALILPAVPAGATVEMQNQAKKLGFAVKNCLDCHASPHSVDVMKEKARATGMADGNCVACHGANIPAALNLKGEWLVSEKGRRRAKECDMAWLKDYKQPVAPKAPAAKPAPKPETIQLAPKP
jgi:Zn-finger protein